MKERKIIRWAVVCLVMLCQSYLTANAQSTLIVNNTADSGAGSLRQAILDANSTPNTGDLADRIEFQIADTDPNYIAESGYWIILLESSLPVITEALTVDGESAGLNADEIPPIVITGHGFEEGTGIHIESDDVTIRYLAILNFGAFNVRITGDAPTRNTIEHCWIGEKPRTFPYDVVVVNGINVENGFRNNILNNRFDDNKFPIRIIDGAGENLVAGNHLNENFFYNIRVENAPRNIIGTTEVGNTIINGTGTAISIEGELAVGNIVQNNEVGVRDGILGNGNNGSGIHISGADSTVVGGSLPNQGNYVVNSNVYGIAVFDATGTVIQGNEIGFSGIILAPNKNNGIIFGLGAYGNLVGGDAPGEANEFGSNGPPVLEFIESAGNGNEIRNNRFKVQYDPTFDLNSDGPTLNDPGDADEGPNRLQNYPEILKTRYNAETGEASITYLVDSDPANSTYPITVRFHETLFDTVLVADVYEEAEAGQAKLLEFTVEPGTSLTPVWSTATDAEGNTSESSPLGEGFNEYRVTTTADSGEGSFRQAILDANAAMNGTATELIGFSLPGDPPYVIELLSPLPAISDTVLILGGSQPGYAGEPLIVLDGSQSQEETNGLTVTGNDVLIRDLYFQHFTGHGIAFINSSGGEVRSVRIGLETDGSTIAGIAGAGIYLENTSNTVINPFGTGPEVVIAGAGQAGVLMTGAETTGNELHAALIGTDVTGLVEAGSQTVGIELSDGANGNFIGRAGSQGYKLIAVGSDVGVLVHDGASDNVIRRTVVGLGLGASAPLPNGVGILVNDGPGTRLEGNVVGSNLGDGIRIESVSSAGIVLFDNRVGTGLDLSLERPNGRHGIYIESPGVTLRENTTVFNVGNGVHIEGTDASNTILTNNKIGVSGLFSLEVRPNQGDGIRIVDAPSAIIGYAHKDSTNYIEGNLGSGIHISGTEAVGVQIHGNHIAGNQYGILVDGTPSTQIGGSEIAAGNDIFGNESAGIYLKGSATSGTVVQGNQIGIHANFELANEVGIKIENAPQTIVGGVSELSANHIASNTTYGIVVEGAGVTGTTVQGNLIGPDEDIRCELGVDWPGNQSGGIFLAGGAGNVVIGGTEEGEGNHILCNAGPGIGIHETAGEGITVSGNAIHKNRLLPIDLQASGDPHPTDTTDFHTSFNDPGDADQGPNRMQNYPEVVSRVSTSDNNLVTVRYLLSSTPENTAYPVRVEFYEASEYGGSLEWVATDVVEASEAGDTLTFNFIARLLYRDVVASATDAAGNTSEYSPFVIKQAFTMGQTQLFDHPLFRVRLSMTALDKDALVSIKRTTRSADPPEGFFVGLAGLWVLKEETGAAFDVTTCFYTDGLILSEAIDVRDYHIFRRQFVGAQWVALPTTAQDENLVCAEHIDEIGEFGVFTDVNPATVSTEDIDPGLPTDFAVYQNHPNPFASQTTLSFDLPEPSNVEVTVYDMLGRQIRQWVNRDFSAGRHSITLRANDLRSGTYYFVFSAGDFKASRAMMLVK